MAFAPPRTLPIFAPMAGPMAAGGSPRARLEALMREIAARVQPQVIHPQLHEAARGRGGFPSPVAVPSETPSLPHLPARPSAAAGARSVGASRGASPLGSRPTATTQVPAPSAIENLSRAADLARNLGVLGNIGNLASAIASGSLNSAAATGLGALGRALPLAWNYGSASAVPAGAELAGLTAAAFRPEAIAAVPGGAGIGITTGGLASSGAGGMTNVATGTAAGAAGGGLLGSIGGLAAASPLLIAAPLFAFGLHSLFADKGRTVGNALFDVTDGRVGLRDLGVKDMDPNIVRAFSLGGVQPLMQAVQDVGGSYAGDRLSGTFGTHSDYDGWFVEVPERLENGRPVGRRLLTGFSSPEEAARRFALEQARLGSISAPDRAALEQAIDRRYDGFRIADLDLEALLPPPFGPKELLASKGLDPASLARQPDPLINVLNFFGPPHSVREALHPKELAMRQMQYYAPEQTDRSRPWWQLPAPAAPAGGATRLKGLLSEGMWP